jgi:hypothetical protein
VDPHALRVVSYEGAGQWLIGGHAGLIALYSEGRITRLPAPSTQATLGVMSGDFRDLAVVGGSLPNGTPLLAAYVGQHWLKPLELPELASLPGLARVDRERWLIAGRARKGGAFLAWYFPLSWRIERLPADDVRAYLAADAAPEDVLGVVVGAGGRVVRVEAGAISRSTVPDGVDLSSVTLDDEGRLWTASLGTLWTQTPTGTFERAWREPRWKVPLVSLYADQRRVLGVAADGGMIEGLLA